MSERIQRLLEKDEVILYEGAPRGFSRPRKTEILGYVLFLGMGLLILGLGWWSVRGYPNAS